MQHRPQASRWREVSLPEGIVNYVKMWMHAKISRSSQFSTYEDGFSTGCRGWYTPMRKGQLQGRCRSLAEDLHRQALSECRGWVWPSVWSTTSCPLGVHRAGGDNVTATDRLGVRDSDRGSETDTDAKDGGPVQDCQAENGKGPVSWHSYAIQKLPIKLEGTQTSEAQGLALRYYHFQHNFKFQRFV